MDTSLYVAYSALQADMRAVDIAANNLANVNTTGFREERPFVTALEFAGEQYPSIGGTKSKTKPGPMTATGRELDVAIENDGFLVVQTPDGRRYTRDGGLSLSEDGTLVTRSGHPILGQGGPIQVPTERDGKIEIDPEGRVLVSSVQEGRLLLVDVPTDSLVRERGGLFRSEGGGETPLEQGRLLQGFLEKSNVEIPSGNLNQLRRHFQALSRAIQVINTLDRRLIGMTRQG